MKETPLYEKWGGIQLMSKLRYNQFNEVPRNELFANTKRNTTAVDIALSGLKADHPGQETGTIQAFHCQAVKT